MLTQVEWRMKRVRSEGRCSADVSVGRCASHAVKENVTSHEITSHEMRVKAVE